MSDNSSTWSPGGQRISPCPSCLAGAPSIALLLTAKEAQNGAALWVPGQSGKFCPGRYLPTLGQIAHHCLTPKVHQKHGSLSPQLPPDQQCSRAEAIPAHMLWAPIHFPDLGLVILPSLIGSSMLLRTFRFKNIYILTLAF